MEARNPHDDSARDAKTKIRLIQLGNVSSERDTAFDTLTGPHAHLVQLALHDFLESRRGGGKYLQSRLFTD
jgi:hypothetical protein